MLWCGLLCPFKIHEALRSDMTDLEIGTLRRWLKLNEVIREELWPNRTDVLLGVISLENRDTRDLSLSTMCGYMKRQLSAPRKIALGRTWPWCILILYLQTPELWENKFLLFKPQSIVILLWQSEQTKTSYHIPWWHLL
jgi:hypothetical protein